MQITKIICCSFVLVFGSASGLTLNSQDQSRDVFWEKFRAAVIKKDKTTISSLSQFPISMPYGMGTVRTKAQLIKRYRDVFNHEGDAAICFKDAKPETDPSRPKEFTVACKNGAGDEVVIYSFVLTKLGWRFNRLDNLNE
jgi:hypothetical protein